MHLGMYIMYYGRHLNFPTIQLMYNFVEINDYIVDIHFIYREHYLIFISIILGIWPIDVFTFKSFISVINSLFSNKLYRKYKY